MPGAEARAEITATLAGAIAAEAGEGDVELIAEAARLQEIGKLYVEPELRWLPLGDADPVSAESLMAQFEHGHALARSAGLPNRACAWILNARERWDGGGPTGLAGADIPAGSRVIAVCREYVDAPQSVQGGAAEDPRAAGVRRLHALAGSVLDPGLATIAARLVAAPPPASLDVVRANGAERSAALELAAGDAGRRPPGDLPLLLARDAGGGAAGALAWADREDLDAILIAGLWVREQGAGTGTALIEAVAEIATEAKRSWLVAAVGNDELGALGFLQRRGFRLQRLSAGALADVAIAAPWAARSPIAPRDLLVLERAV